MFDDWFERSLFGLIALITLGLIGCMVDCATARTVEQDGTVIERTHTDASVSTGVGMAGKSPVVVTSSTPEQWKVIVDCGNDAYSADATAAQWKDAIPGKPVRIARRIGKLACWDVRVIRIGT